jgi:predicted metal-binding protein
MADDSAFPTTAKTRETIRNLYNKVKLTSETAGAKPSLGLNQRGALGALNTYSSAAVVNGLSIETANRIASNPEQYIDRFNALGYVDANGNPMTFTAEGLKSGLEGIQGLSEADRAEAIAKALRSNPALRVATVASVAGTMSLNPDSFVESVMERGFTGMTAEDIDRFMEEADDSQKMAVQEMLGVEDMRTVSAQEIAARAEAFNKAGGTKVYRERKAFVEGYYFAFSLSDCGLCKECAGFTNGECRNVVKARPAFHSVGIDVFKTVRQLGLPINTLFDPAAEEQNWYAAVFVE